MPLSSHAVSTAVSQGGAEINLEAGSPICAQILKHRGGSQKSLLTSLQGFKVWELVESMVPRSPR